METWGVLLSSHVVAALFALAIGPIQILRRRRDSIHRTMGYLWAAAMYYVCFSSFWIVTDGHFTWLHGLSAFTIITVTLGVVSAIRRNIKAHLGNMIGSYIGLAIAFVFAAAVPGRAIPRLLAEDPTSALFVGALVMLGVGVVFVSLKRGGSGHSPTRLRRRKRSSSDSLPGAELAAERALNHPVA